MILRRISTDRPIDRLNGWKKKNPVKRVRSSFWKGPVRLFAVTDSIYRTFSTSRRVSFRKLLRISVAVRQDWASWRLFLIKSIGFCWSVKWKVEWINQINLTRVILILLNKKKNQWFVLNFFFFFFSAIRLLIIVHDQTIEKNSDLSIDWNGSKVNYVDYKYKLKKKWV